MNHTWKELVLFVVQQVVDLISCCLVLQKYGLLDCIWKEQDFSSWTKERVVTWCKRSSKNSSKCLEFYGGDVEKRFCFLVLEISTSHGISCAQTNKMRHLWFLVVSLKTFFQKSGFGLLKTFHLLIREIFRSKELKPVQFFVIYAVRSRPVVSYILDAYRQVDK